MGEICRYVCLIFQSILTIFYILGSNLLHVLSDFPLLVVHVFGTFGGLLLYFLIIFCILGGFFRALIEFFLTGGSELHNYFTI